MEFAAGGDLWQVRQRLQAPVLETNVIEYSVKYYLD